MVMNAIGNQKKKKNGRWEPPALPIAENIIKHMVLNGNAQNAWVGEGGHSVRDSGDFVTPLAVLALRVNPKLDDRQKPQSADLGRAC